MGKKKGEKHVGMNRYMSEELSKATQEFANKSFEALSEEEKKNLEDQAKKLREKSRGAVCSVVLVRLSCFL